MVHLEAGGSSPLPPAPAKDKMLSKNNEKLIYAYKKGYRCIDGNVYSSFNNKLALTLHKSTGYLTFNIKLKNKNATMVYVHRLVAYQKFGDKLFEPGIETRHLDNNKLNNLDENIKIGTKSQNMMDKPKEERTRISKMGSEVARKINKKYDYEEIKDFYNRCRSYAQTMRKFDISSKGTLHYILKQGWC